MRLNQGGETDEGGEFDTLVRAPALKVELSAAECMGRDWGISGSLYY